MSNAPEPRYPMNDPREPGSSEKEPVHKPRINWIEDDTINVRTRIEAMEIDEAVSRSVVYGEVKHEEPEEEDDGLVHELPDGSISIPVLEEQIVITKKTVVRERIVVRRRTETEVVHVRDRLHRDEIEVEENEKFDVTHVPGRSKPFPLSSADPTRRVSGQGR